MGLCKQNLSGSLRDLESAYCFVEGGFLTWFVIIPYNLIWSWCGHLWSIFCWCQEIWNQVDNLMTRNICSVLQMGGMFEGMLTGFAQESIFADWILSACISYSRLWLELLMFLWLGFDLFLIFFSVGITIYFWGFFSLAKNSWLSALGNDIHARNCMHFLIWYIMLLTQLP